MRKEIDDLYCYLEKLEEAYRTENSNCQEYLALNEARTKVVFIDVMETGWA